MTNAVETPLGTKDVFVLMREHYDMAKELERLRPLAKRKRAGRPQRQPEEGERVQLSFRITPELKRALMAAAEKSGRSQSQEAEFRLEKSFWFAMKI